MAADRTRAEVNRNGYAMQPRSTRNDPLIRGLRKTAAGRKLARPNDATRARYLPICSYYDP